MMNMLNLRDLRAVLRTSIDLWRWQARGFRMPVPDAVKRTVLKRLALPDSVWVETGTYRGDTTALLSQLARRVISLEPAPELFARAQQRFRHTANVEILNAPSEDALPAVLAGLGGNVCFWLDGHFSGGITHRGPNDTPVLHELAAIEANLPRWPRALILVDDVRLFTGKVCADGAYPPLRALVDWAERLGLHWHVEHDIFAASKL